jgi:hypothetical protein
MEENTHFSRKKGKSKFLEKHPAISCIKMVGPPTSVSRAHLSAIVSCVLEMPKLTTYFSEDGSALQYHDGNCVKYTLEIMRRVMAWEQLGLQESLSARQLIDSLKTGGRV